MAREICIKTKDGVYCKSSPIRDCSCKRMEFEDPYDDAKADREVTLGDQEEQFLKDMKMVIKKWVAFRDEKDSSKLGVIATIARLILLNEVTIDETFIITAFKR